MMRSYEIRKNEGVKYISAPALDVLNLVYHAFSTKVGGVSTGPFKGMNLSLSVGEDNDFVDINRCMLAKALRAGNPEIYTVRQMHGTRVIRIESKDHPPEEYRQAQADAILTDQPGIGIGVLTADCVPVLLVDPVHKAIGAVHAGREGTLMHIVSHVIRRMQSDFGTTPEDLRAAVGPCIEASCYEVGEGIVTSALEQGLHREDVLIRRNGSHFMDLRMMNHLDLVGSGVKEQHVYHVPMCTACHPRTFYSHRRSKGRKTGRMMAFLMLKEEA